MNAAAIAEAWAEAVMKARAPHYVIAESEEARAGFKDARDVAYAPECIKRVWMYPDEYLRLVETFQGPKTSADRPRIDAMRERLRAGEPLTVPWLSLNPDGVLAGQDGRHRAWAAEEEGITELPVDLILLGSTWDDQSDLLGRVGIWETPDPAVVVSKQHHAKKGLTMDLMTIARESFEAVLKGEREPDLAVTEPLLNDGLPAPDVVVFAPVDEGNSPEPLTEGLSPVGTPDEPLSIHKLIPFLIPVEKSGEPERRITLGVVLEPGTEDEQGDVMTPEDIEKAAHQWMIESQAAGDMHRAVVKGAKPVESYIAPCDFTIETADGPETVLKGSWLLAMRWPEEQWEKVKKGEYTGYSVGGQGVRTPLERVDKAGRGRMGGPLAAGPDGACVCPSCGHREAHDAGEPCTDLACPECGTMMVREEPEKREGSL